MLSRTCSQACPQTRDPEEGPGCLTGPPLRIPLRSLSPRPSSAPRPGPGARARDVGTVLLRPGLPGTATEPRGRAGSAPGLLRGGGGGPTRSSWLTREGRARRLQAPSVGLGAPGPPRHTPGSTARPPARPTQRPWASAPTPAGRRTRPGAGDPGLRHLPRPPPTSATSATSPDRKPRRPGRQGGGLRRGGETRAASAPRWLRKPRHVHGRRAETPSGSGPERSGSPGGAAF